MIYQMAKTRRSKSKKEAKAPVKTGPEKTLPEPDEDKPFDFGGLPQRDLKKNLGCG
jgi:hypothetical protein